MASWRNALASPAQPTGSVFGVRVLKSAIAQLAAPTLTFKPSIDKSKMCSTAVLTTRNPDRQGDIIDPAGGDFSEHEVNPIVMFHHGKAGHKLPIGKAEDPDGNYTVRLVKAHDGSDVLVGTTHFSQSSRFANDVFGLIAEDTLRGVSIGFDPLSDRDSVDELGPSPTLKRPALHFKGWKLLEYSHTPLGVNRDALTVAVTKAVENPRLMHPVLLKYLQPMATPRRTTVAVTAPVHRKAAMPMPMPSDEDDTGTDEGDAGMDDVDDADPGAGAPDSGYDPTSDAPGDDPALKGTGYGTPDDDAPSPTVQTLLDGSQGLLDLCSAVETSMKKSEHMKGRKFAAKLCADLRSTAAEAKSFADQIRAELSGAGSAPDADTGEDEDEDADSEPDADADDEGGGDDDEGAEAPETDDEGAIVTKGYAPRRWTYADLSGQPAPVSAASGVTAGQLKAVERERDQLKRALGNVLADIEASARRKAR